MVGGRLQPINQAMELLNRLAPPVVVVRGDNAAFAGTEADAVPSDVPVWKCGKRMVSRNIFR
jgi:hypothetical protein